MNNNMRPWMGEKDCLNTERLVTSLAGIFLMVYGLTRRTLAAIIIALSGGYLLLRSISGQGFLCDRPRHSTLPGSPPEPKVPQEVAQGDSVTEASWESFPASDPPAWTSG